jgi:hypothetical protein
MCPSGINASTDIDSLDVVEWRQRGRNSAFKLVAAKNAWNDVSISRT